jgi:ubiquinone/menaquinone biosynthesis C-methylase UbiE
LLYLCRLSFSDPERSEIVKGRESGMPDEAYWSSFFDVEAAIGKLLKGTNAGSDLVEFGCGYGTFTIPAAGLIKGRVTAFDIDPAMVAFVQGRACELGLANIDVHERDFAVLGTGLEAYSQAHAMIYNLLHLEDPVALLREAHRVLHKGGSLSVIHWRSDVETPRGPSLDIRPTPRQCQAWIEEAGFGVIEEIDLRECCPYHFGLIASVRS